MGNYIEDNLLDIRNLLDVLLTYKENIANDNKFAIFDYKNEDLKKFKIVLLSVLFTENFDDISENIDETLKRDILNNVRIKRRNTKFSYEDGGLFEIGKGFTINKLPSVVAPNDYTRILRMIRNGIAHSKYTYNNGVVNISLFNDEFNVDCDVDWLEMMILCLFSNRQTTTKEGAKDIQIELYDLGFDNLYDFSSIRGYVLNVENGNDSSALLYHKIASKNETNLKMMYEQVEIPYDEYEYYLKELYNLFNIEIKSIEKIKNIREIILGLQTIERYNELTINKKETILGDRLYSYYDEERKNTLSYKNTLELLKILKGSLDKQFKKINRVGIDFMVDYMSEYVFKSYINFVYNYMGEKLNFSISEADITNLNIKSSDPYNKEEFIKHIRNSLCHNRVKINGDDVYIYDENKRGVITFELNTSISEFIEITDKIICELTKNKVINNINIVKKK